MIRSYLRERLGIVRAIVATLTVVMPLVSASPSMAPAQDTRRLSYDEFIALDSDTRREQLAQMRPETIAAFKLTHAERWFATHRNQLSREQVAVFVDALAFITVDIYKRPDDPDARNREAILTHRLTCVLGPENTRQAFVLHLPPEPVRSGWRSTVDAWLSWFVDCIIP